MFSVGVLYRTQEFLEFLTGNRVTAAQFKASFPSFRQVSSEHVLGTSHMCNWIEINAADELELTVTGKEIANAEDASARLRMQIRDLLRYSTPRPTWAALLPRGRKAVRLFANADVVQCFRDAGLLEDPDEQLASWWDSVAVPVRESQTAHLLEIGRKGEWCSMKYEQERVGQRPEWTALDHSDAGYDLLSVVGRTSRERLLIEVKSTERSWNTACFYLSRNEWDILTTHDHASLHLWSFNGHPPLLLTVAAKSLLPHIPVDAGLGQWSQATIPFRCVGQGLPIRIGTSA